VAVGAIGDFVLAFYVVDGVVHFEWGENVLVEKFRERLAGNFGDDQAENYVSRVAVVPLRTGRKHAVIGLFKQG